MADVHAAVDDDAFDRSGDGGVFEVGLVIPQIGLGNADVGLANVKVRLGDFVGGLVLVEFLLKNAAGLDDAGLNSTSGIRGTKVSSPCRGIACGLSSVRFSY